MLLVLYSVVVATPSLRAFFELTPLPGLDCLLIGMVVVAVWVLLLRHIWRAWLLERLLDLKVTGTISGTQH